MPESLDDFVARMASEVSSRGSDQCFLFLRGDDKWHLVSNMTAASVAQMFSDVVVANPLVAVALSLQSAFVGAPAPGGESVH